MKRQNIQDERVAIQRRKVNSEAFGILMLALLASIIVQQFFLEAAFEQYAGEFICFFIMSIYLIVRFMTLGLNIFSEGKRVKNISILNSIVAGIVVTTINGVLNYTQNAEHYQNDKIVYFIAVLGITFFNAFVFVFTVLSFISYLNKKKQAKIQKRLDEDEKS